MELIALNTRTPSAGVSNGEIPPHREERNVLLVVSLHKQRGQRLSRSVGLVDLCSSSQVRAIPKALS